MLKDELEAIISSDEIWSSRSTLILAVGIIGEYAIVKLLEHASVNWLRGLFKGARAITLVEWRRQACIVLEVLFAVMVVLGVFGEYGFSSRIARNATRLQQIADQELADANVLAAAAQVRAGEANKVAGIANREAKELQVQLENANGRVAEAEARISAANLAAAEAQSMARSSELARVELEERIAPRTLLVGQREYLGKKLSKFAWSFVGRAVKIDWALSDIEQTIFAVEVEDAIKRAFITVERPQSIAVDRPLYFGINVTAPSRDGGFARTLFWFLYANFPREAVVLDLRPDNLAQTVTVRIGAKTPDGLVTLPIGEVQ